LESGADDCIGWPFNVDILKARIKNLVDHRKHLMDKIWLEAILHISQLNIKSEDSKFIEQLHGIIEENLSNPLFTVGDLGKKLYMSRASMYRKIHYLSGLSPQLYIRSYRLKRAAQLLENHYGNVTEVCFKVGFTSTAYFAKCFKEEFHQTPKTFVSRFASGLSPVSTLTMHGNV
jgi:AraC-like DNA-binding protein